MVRGLVPNSQLSQLKVKRVGEFLLRDEWTQTLLKDKSFLFTSLRIDLGT